MLVDCLNGNVDAASAVFHCAPPHSCMELIELLWWWTSIHSQVSRLGGGVKRFKQRDIHWCSLHLLISVISDAIFIFTHTHMQKCTFTREGCPSHLFKDLSWAFVLIRFVCFLPPFPVIFFYFTFISHCWDHNLQQLTCFHLCRDIQILVHLILENGF